MSLGSIVQTVLFKCARTYGIQCDEGDFPNWELEKLLARSGSHYRIRNKTSKPHDNVKYSLRRILGCHGHIPHTVQPMIAN